MGDIVNSFKSAVNANLRHPVNVVSGNIDSILPAKETFVSSLEESKVEEALTVEEAASKVMDKANEVAKSVESVENNGKKILSFHFGEENLPYHFKSYDEMAATILGNIFYTEGLKSINLSYFGEFFNHINPKGFTSVEFGGYKFIVRDNSDRMHYVFEFLMKAKDSLLSEREFRCSLVEEVEINYDKAYTLVLTPKELFDIQKSYPEYRLSYTTGDHITDLHLIIQVGD